MITHGSKGGSCTSFPGALSLKSVEKQTGNNSSAELGLPLLPVRLIIILIMGCIMMKIGMDKITSIRSDKVVETGLFLISAVCVMLVHKAMPSSPLHFTRWKCRLASCAFGLFLVFCRWQVLNLHHAIELPVDCADCALMGLSSIICPFGLDEAAVGSGLDAARNLQKSSDESKKQDEATKKDAAEEGYTLVEKQLGGRAGIEKYAAKSQQLEAEVKRKLGGIEPWRQDVIFHHEGLEALIAHGEKNIKPKFDALVKDLAKKFQAKACIPGVKGADRSRVKVNVRYGGDASNSVTLCGQLWSSRCIPTYLRTYTQLSNTWSMQAS
jgi:hypothetical protein